MQRVHTSATVTLAPRGLLVSCLHTHRSSHTVAQVNTSLVVLSNRLDCAVTPGSTAARLKSNSTNAWKRTLQTLHGLLTYCTYCISTWKMTEVKDNWMKSHSRFHLLTTVTFSRFSSAEDRTESSQSSCSLLSPPLNMVNLRSTPSVSETHNPLLISLGSVKWHKFNKNVYKWTY